MEYTLVEKILDADTIAAFKKKAYKLAIDHHFCDSDEDTFPKNIWDEIRSHDKYDLVSELNNVVVYCEYEDCTIDQLASSLWEYETTMYRSMIEAIGAIFDKIGGEHTARELLRKAA